MKLLISLSTSLVLAVNTLPWNIHREDGTDRMINAFIMAYDEMYKGFTDLPDDYIILDLESIHFIDTTYEDRQKAIEYFKKYNKTILNASLFKLQEIGLAGSNGQLKIKGILLMITCIQPDEKGGVIIEGYKWHGPVAAYNYKLRFKVVDEKWIFVEVVSLGIA